MPRGEKKTAPQPATAKGHYRELEDEFTRLAPRQQYPLRLAGREGDPLARWFLKHHPNPDPEPMGFAQEVAARGGCRMITETELLERLGGAKRVGKQWFVKCPAHHPDNDPSLAVTMGDSGWLLHCHAGCNQDAVISALPFEKRELFADADTHSAIIDSYDYTDANGTLLYQVCRFFPKDFRQRRPDGVGGWEWNLNGVRRVLYHLP